MYATAYSVAPAPYGSRDDQAILLRTSDSSLVWSSEWACSASSWSIWDVLHLPRPSCARAAPDICRSLRGGCMADVQKPGSGGMRVVAKLFPIPSSCDRSAVSSLEE